MALHHDTELAPDDLAPGERRLVDTPRGRFVVVRSEAGGGSGSGGLPGLETPPEFLAFAAWCPHLDGPLWEGSIQGDEIGCPWHSWRYSLATGKCTWAPRGDEEEAAETELERARCVAGPSGKLRLEFEDV
ncbi:MAG: Rieske 2Fe-2S domain-containing protein [Planctomycetota bacterium]